MESASRPFMITLRSSFTPEASPTSPPMALARQPRALRKAPTACDSGPLSRSGIRAPPTEINPRMAQSTTAARLPTMRATSRIVVFGTVLTSR